MSIFVRYLFLWLLVGGEWQDVLGVSRIFRRSVRRLQRDGGCWWLRNFWKQINVVSARNIEVSGYCVVESVHFARARREVDEVNFSLICLDNNNIVILLNSALSECSLLCWSFVNWAESLYLGPDCEHLLLCVAVLAHCAEVLVEPLDRYMPTNQQCEIFANQVTLHVHLVHSDFNWFEIVLWLFLYQNFTVTACNSLFRAICEERDFRSASEGWKEFEPVLLCDNVIVLALH